MLLLLEAFLAAHLMGFVFGLFSLLQLLRAESIHWCSVHMALIIQPLNSSPTYGSQLETIWEDDGKYLKASSVSSLQCWLLQRFNAVNKWARLAFYSLLPSLVLHLLLTNCRSRFPRKVGSGVYDYKLRDFSCGKVNADSDGLRGCVRNVLQLAGTACNLISGLI